jgi:hypothetical protein
MSKIKDVIERSLKSFSHDAVFELPNNTSGIVVHRGEGDHVDIFFVKNTLADNLNKEKIYSGHLNKVDVKSLKQIVKEKML